MVNLRLRRHEGEDGINSFNVSKNDVDDKQRKQYCTLRNVQLLAVGLLFFYFSISRLPTPSTNTQTTAVASVIASSPNNDSPDETETIPSSSSPSSWTWESPHLVNCHQLLQSLADDDTPSQDTGKFVTTKTNPPFLMNIHDPNKDSISKAIESSGCWECNHLNEVIHALSLHPDSYFLDVGANIGMWSLTAAAAGFPTISIEQFMQNYRRICKSVVENGKSFVDLVNVVNAVATSTPEEFRLEFLDNNFGGTHVVPVSKGEKEDENDEKEGRGMEKMTIIKGYPIDSLQLPTDRPVVMKVDVEGHELQALKGALHFLEEANIVYAMMELRPDVKSNPDWKEIFEVLDSNGLKPYRINYEGMEDTRLDVNRLDEWKHFKHPNVRYYDVAWRKEH